MTIISGVPGSHKEVLCGVLTRLAKEDCRWAIIQQPIDSAAPYSPTTVQESLAATWNAQKRHKSPTSTAKNIRVLIVSPG